MKTKGKADDIDKAVGRNLKLLSKERGFTQEQLGKIIGKTFQQVQKQIKGQDRISPSYLARYSKALGVPIDMFFPDEYHTTNKELIKENKRLRETLDRISAIVSGPKDAA